LASNGIGEHCAIFAAAERRVLLWDLDPQAHRGFIIFEVRARGDLQAQDSAFSAAIKTATRTWICCRDLRPA
jgi:hypothetical protein